MIVSLFYVVCRRRLRIRLLAPLRCKRFAEHHLWAYTSACAPLWQPYCQEGSFCSTRCKTTVTCLRYGCTALSALRLMIQLNRNNDVAQQFPSKKGHARRLEHDTFRTTWSKPHWRGPDTVYVCTCLPMGGKTLASPYPPLTIYTYNYVCVYIYIYI